MSQRAGTKMSTPDGYCRQRVSSKGEFGGARAVPKSMRGPGHISLRGAGREVASGRTEELAAMVGPVGDCLRGGAHQSAGSRAAAPLIHP